MRSRPERFGAWVRLDDATLVAVDRVRARTLGIDGGALWDDPRDVPPSLPLEVHVAVTSRCTRSCTDCYQRVVGPEVDVPRERLQSTLRALADAGVFTVAFGGGEPLRRDDLGDLAGDARALGLVPVVTTSGVGLDPARARTLHAFAQVNVSHDGVGGGYTAVRGWDGAGVADRAVRALVAAGVAVGVNHMLTRDNVQALAGTVRHARALGAGEIQLLRFKPAGRAASDRYRTRRLTPDPVRSLGTQLRDVVAEHAGALSVRIDCALVPLLADAFDDVEALRRFGVFGCEAGRHLGAVCLDGTVAPCSFLPGTGAPAADLARCWTCDPGLAARRDFVRALPEPCASCTLGGVCRGGCQAVAGFLGGGLHPDPECPRVIASGAGGRMGGY